VTATNKSRIDFFLVSEALLPKVSDCIISDHLQSGQFDHKAVILKFCALNKTLKRFSVSNRIVNDPDLSKLIELCIFEVLLTYQVRPNIDRWRLLERVGSARKFLRDAGPDPDFYNLSSLSETEVAERNTCLNSVQLILQDNELNALYDFDFTIGPDILFEMILNTLRNEIQTYQTFVFRQISKAKDLLRSELKILQADPVINFRDISLKELELCRISEEEIRLALENHPIFEHINSEKMSPIFLRLAKGINSGGSLFCIRDDINEEFLFSADRMDFRILLLKNSGTSLGSHC
jgi:hypothetical protein